MVQVEGAAVVVEMVNSGLRRSPIVPVVVFDAVETECASAAVLDVNVVVWVELISAAVDCLLAVEAPTSIETDEAVVGMAEFESYEEAVLPGVAVVLLVDESPGEADAAVPSYGRLDQVVSIEPPTQTERLEILRIMTKTWQVDERFLSQLSESTGGFVGADLLSLCQKALQVCMNEAAATKMQGNAVVCPHHFEQALAVTYPSVLQTHNVSQKQQQLTSTSIQKHGGIN